MKLGKYSHCLILAVIFFFIIGARAQATLFIPVPIEEQIHNAYAVIHAKYMSSSYKKLNSGEVVTEATFEIITSAGLKNNEVINKNNFKVLFPGGIWQDVVYQVYGAPKFTDGEEVVLFLKKGNFGYYMANLSLSKFLVKAKRGNKFIQSSVFPYHPKLGHIEFKDLNFKLKIKFGTELIALNQDKYIDKRPIVSQNSAKSHREPASSRAGNNKEVDDERLGITWLILLLSLMGAYSAYAIKGKD